MIVTMEIPGWQPTPLNKLIGGHWGTAARRKKHDREIIGRACMIYDVPQAHGKRRVGIHVVLPPKQRAVDPDSLFKSLLDALVASGALVDDNRQNVAFTQPTFSRGDALCSYVTVEDVL